MEDVNFNPNAADTVQLVKDAVSWVLSQDKDNNYMHNLKTVCSLEYVTGGNLGILVSLFPTYNRELEYQAERAEQERKRAVERATEANSQHIGNIGDRIDVQVHSVTCLTSWETEWGDQVYKIVDVNVNVYLEN